jgi:hypothetical protein
LWKSSFSTKKEKEPKRKKWGGLMETDAAVDKISDLQVLPTAAWKSLLALPQFPQARRR